MLPIYTGTDFFAPDVPPPVPMVLPWRATMDNSIMGAGIFDEYVRVAHMIFSEVPLAAAAAGVLPFSWKYTLHSPALRQWATDFARLLADAGKPVIIFFDSDSVESIDLPNAIVFRTSSCRSRRRGNEFGLPRLGAGSAEPSPPRTTRTAREGAVPVVSFCGYAPPLAIPPGGRKAKECLRWALVRTGLHAVLDVQPGYYARVQAIRSCRRTSGVETNFLLRSEPSFVVGSDAWGTGRLRGDSDSPATFRSDFVRNMLDSDYVLCARGYGNYSFRLYEALSCGRIPLFVNTNCLLPFHDHAGWRSATLWVDEADVHSVGERVRQFHAALSPDAFLARQYAARQFWEQWLAPVAFFRRLASDRGALRHFCRGWHA